MKHKAVGLLSGGLDSSLACKLLIDQGIEVHVVHLLMPWGCGKPLRVKKIADTFGIPLKVIPLADDYLQVLTKPKHGFGSAHNPCVDCHIYMVKKAAEYMREIGAEFIFTGEVLGQRPMSQRRVCLGWVEKDAGIEGRLLRPLCAQLLEPTIPETEGIVDRSRLLGISGRSRTPQYALAKEIGVEHFSAPGGGCLLTEQVFGKRVKDVLARGCDSIETLAILGQGRYFRLSDDAYAILGRDERENTRLFEYARPQDILLQPTAFPGPWGAVRGGAVSERDLSLVAGIIQYFSKFRNEPGLPVSSWLKSAPEIVRDVTAVVPDEPTVKSMWM